ncbi:uncharacterized protein PHACADRAFT_252739 [Phanerochaete carnosa HHB-10118-sp]|uniref:Uncharacterized protein n=1 Tax=Phanerochaete carnosa (strain HHB-10118-sp) TaxID=650164 RepID=K5V6S9_PHACS|nr:uncharacterized protein PHACADRAFT_252739 [Phanerochaete carnosa HHB-10118-sp]EKM58426.1 hypothetical protein PHACADRAFT_252739 [Phanerochaete carnosa HHB-10118-sp]
MSEVIVESPTEDDDDDGDDFVPELPGLHPRKSSADHAQTVRRRGLFKRGDTTTPVRIP